MDIIPANPSHLIDFVSRDNEAIWKDHYENSELTFVAVSEGEILAVAGFIECFPGCYSIWASFSDMARGNSVSLVKKMEEVLPKIVDKLKIFRLQAYVLADNHEYNKFIRLFGFELEGRIRKATPLKEDMFLYSRIW